MVVLVFLVNGDGDFFSGGADLELSLEQKQTLNSIYAVIQQLRELKVINSSSDGIVWYISMAEGRKKGGDDQTVANADLLFDAVTRELISYYYSNPSKATAGYPPVELAVERANALIELFMGEQEEQYQMAGVGSGSGSNLTGLEVYYCPLINGIPFVDVPIRIIVDATGHIITYQRHPDGWGGNLPDPSAFPHPTQVMITGDDAVRMMAERITMELCYLPGETTTTKPGNTTLVYRVEGLPIDINAMTGEDLNLLIMLKFHGTEVLKKEKVTLTGQGDNLIVSDRNQAEDLLSRLLGVDMRLMTDYYQDKMPQEFYPGGSVLGYHWSGNQGWDQGEAAGSLLSIGLYTRENSGEVLTLTTYTDAELPGGKVLSQEEALDVALDIMAKALPKGDADFLVQIMPIYPVTDWDEQTNTVQIDPGIPQEIVFTFTRIHQGIPIVTPIAANMGQFGVSVRPATGLVTSFNCFDPFVPTNFPEIGSIISAEEAKREYIAKNPLQLVYTQTNSHLQQTPTTEPILMYTTQHSNEPIFYIDALTGEAVKP